jgi:hypothetical protein
VASLMNAPACRETVPPGDQDHGGDTHAGHERPGADTLPHCEGEIRGLSVRDRGDLGEEVRPAVAEREQRGASDVGGEGEPPANVGNGGREVGLRRERESTEENHLRRKWWKKEEQ